jgi:hypothetical protein
MLRNDQIEEIVTAISAMNRAALIDQFRTYPTRFPLDLTDDFLNTASVERLRHIFLAVCLQNQRSPFREAIAA